MHEHYTVLVLIYHFRWISVAHATKVSSYDKDVLNPLNVDSYEAHQLEHDARVAIRANNRLTCEKPSFYFCEEPAITVPPESGKTCDYRNVQYHEQVFRWVAGRGCLLYTPDFLYVDGTNTIDLNGFCFYGNWFAPCLEIAKEDGTCGCYPFDPGLEEVVRVIHDALLPTARDRWERCFYAATNCCSHFMNENDYADQCRATFDGWTCWLEEKVGTMATEVCAEFAYSNTGPSCHHYSSKQCYENGTWELQTDYSSCSVTPRLLRRYRFYIVVLSFSIVSCLPAVFIFCFYKRLRIPRVALHRNLLIAIILRNIFVIITRSEIYIDELTNSGETVMSTHGVACRLLAFAERFAGNAVFVCMLVEGVYLHRSIVAVFKKKLKLFLLYGVGIVIALAPAIAWAAVMAMYNDHSCWLVYTVQYIQWILDAPRILILVINTGLFVDVLRVLLTKMRNSENANQLNTAKATLFLMPLFGVQFLLTALRPATTNCTGEQVYYYVSYTLEGLQGFIVAMLYCYINKEVRALIQATYKKTENAVVSIIRRDSNFPSSNDGPNDDRRMTCSTGLPSATADDKKEPYTAIIPKLHVAEIISIQASERLAEIFEPLYETIQNGVTNEGYDSLERSDVDTDSGIIPNRESKDDDYYNFDASNLSLECQDWMRCISTPSSSIYNNSLSDYDSKYLDKKIFNRLRPSDNNEKGEKNANKNQELSEEVIKDETDEIEPGFISKNQEPGTIKRENMLDEILEYITDTIDSKKEGLDPAKLCPNRKDNEKIVFINE